MSSTPTQQAADLAEKILEEITKPVQDWRSISVWAGQLSELARAAAQSGR